MLDPVLLRTFVAVAEARSFSRAAAQLGIRQSTASQQVRRLERTVDRQLLVRDTHSVALTADGQAMVGLARAVLDSHERATSYFSGAGLRGRLRFGAGEDFALSRLPEVLREFLASHPQVELELTIELSDALYRRLAARKLDLVLAKRLPGGEPGEPVWRDPLRWLGGEATRLAAGQPVPLVLYPPPSVTRDLALRTLDRHRVPWRIACTSSSLSGIRAAVLAGLGVTAHAGSLVPQGLRPLAPGTLPEPGDVEFVLLGPRTPDRPLTTALTAAILANTHRLRQPC